MDYPKRVVTEGETNKTSDPTCPFQFLSGILFPQPREET